MPAFDHRRERSADRDGSGLPQFALAEVSPQRLGGNAHLRDALNAQIPGVVGTVREFAAGSHLFTHGQVCGESYWIVEGWISRHVTLENGDRHIVDFVLAGDLLNKFDDSSPMRQTAECITPVRARVFPRGVIKGWATNLPGVGADLLEMETAGLARMHDHLVNISCRNARERIAHLLVESFYRVRGRLPSNPGDSLDLPLTHEHIGEALGLTSVHVSRTLTLLREEGVVIVARRRLTVLDPEALAMAAGFEAPNGDRERVSSSLPSALARGASHGSGNHVAETIERVVPVDLQDILKNQSILI